MYQATGSEKQFDDVAKAIGEAVEVVMHTFRRHSTVYFTSLLQGGQQDRNLYTVEITPTRRLSVINLF